MERGVPERCIGLCLEGKANRLAMGKVYRKLSPGRGCKDYIKAIVHCYKTVGLQAEMDYSFVLKY